MQLILSKRTEALTGSLGRGYGYHIQRRKNGFFAKRNTKGIVPNNGHLRFILACAELAQAGLHITNISITAGEFKEAIAHAGQFYGFALDGTPDDQKLNAEEVINYKERYGL